MKKLMLAIAIISLFQNVSCGKQIGSDTPSYENECSFRLIAGKDCIVCDKGGVSCDWN